MEACNLFYEVAFVGVAVVAIRKCLKSLSHSLEIEILGGKKFKQQSIKVAPHCLPRILFYYGNGNDKEEEDDDDENDVHVSCNVYVMLSFSLP